MTELVFYLYFTGYKSFTVMGMYETMADCESVRVELSTKSISEGNIRLSETTCIESMRITPR